MRKVGVFLLSGVAALALVASPFIGAEAFADNKDITVDHIDLTNGQDVVIEDENLAEMFSKMIDASGYGEECFTVKNGKFVQIDDSGEDEPFFCVYKEDDKIVMYDDYLQDEVAVYENLTGLVTCTTNTETSEVSCIWGNLLDSVVLVGDPNNMSASIENLVVNQYIYNIGKIYTGTGFALISGEDQTYIKGSESGLEFHTTGEVRNLDILTVDGNELGEGDYDAENGSIILTLKPSYLDGLSTGKHTLKISFEDEYAGAASIEVDFTVEDNPDTADLPVETFIVFGSCLVLSATSMAYMVNKKSRR